LARLSAEAGLARVVVTQGAQTLADVGSTNAIAPGAPIVRGSPGHPSRMVTVWEISASQYAHELAGTGFGVVVSQGTTTLGSTLRAADGRTWPRRGAMKLDKVSYRFVTQSFTGFGQPQVKVTVLSDLAATNGAVGGSRIVAGLFIAGFLLLSFCFSVLTSRALQGQLGRFLEAARRLGSGDFSSPFRSRGTTSSRPSARSSTACPNSWHTGSRNWTRSGRGSASRSVGSARRLPPTWTARRCSNSL
jgi:hypothetical protein